MTAEKQATKTDKAKWSVKVGDTDYGPYSRSQIERFTSEGRVTAASFVRRGANGPWIEAGSDPLLRDLFHAARARGACGFGRPANENTQADEPPANFVIVAELTSGSAARLGSAIGRLGPAYEINPCVWVLHASATPAGLRNQLVQEIGRGDKLFIADTAHGKFISHNYGPEPEAKLRAVWRKTGG